MDNKDTGWAELEVGGEETLEVDLGSDTTQLGGDTTEPKTEPKQTQAVEKTPENEENQSETPSKRKKDSQTRIRQLIDERRARDAKIAELEQRLAAKEQETLQVGHKTAEYAATQLTGRLEVLKKQLKTAYENGDADAVADLTDKITDAKLEARQLQAVREQMETKVKQYQQPKQPKVESDGDYPPEALAWVEANKDWWGKNDEGSKARMAAAYRFERILREEGKNPEDPEFYEELDQLLDARFGASQKRESRTPATSRPQEMVSGSSRGPQKGTKVRFTKSEYEQAARKWGFKSPDDYARHLLSAEKSQEAGGYTTLEI